MAWLKEGPECREEETDGTTGRDRQASTDQPTALAGVVAITVTEGASRSTVGSTDITVTESGNPTFNINELEYIDGYIYANQYQLPYILKIDPASGKIVAKADLTSMWEKIKAIDPEADVPNGIAYDAATKKMYITGKWWPTLFEIQLGQ